MPDEIFFYRSNRFHPNCMGASMHAIYSGSCNAALVVTSTCTALLNVYSIRNSNDCKHFISSIKIWECVCSPPSPSPGCSLLVTLVLLFLSTSILPCLPNAHCGCGRGFCSMAPLEQAKHCWLVWLLRSVGSTSSVSRGQNF